MDLVRSVGSLIDGLGRGIGSFFGGGGNRGTAGGTTNNIGGGGSASQVDAVAAVKDQAILGLAELIQPKLSQLLVYYFAFLSSAIDREFRKLSSVYLLQSLLFMKNI